MGNIVAFNPCGNCEKKMCLMCELAFRREGAIKNNEWISVDERLPKTTLQKIYIKSQDISSGDVVEEEEKMVQKSELVAVLSKRCLGGTVDVYPDLDYLIDGCWAYNICVTHWMPLPEPPEKEGNK